MRTPLHDEMLEIYKSIGVIDEQAEKALVEAYQKLLKHLPKIYWGEPTGMTVPLHDALDNCGEAISEFALPLLYGTPPDFGPPEAFAALRKQLFENEARMNGLSLRERRKKHIPAPQERTEPPHELCFLYFRDTPLLDLFNAQVPFRITRERFNEHGAIFARSGHGKTQALRSFVAQLLQEPDPPALFLIDSLGALIKDIDRLEVFDTALWDRLVILDPSRREYMPRLNFFTGVQSDELIFYLFKAIDQGFTQRQATMASYLMEYMRHVPSPDLLKLVELCKAKTNPHPDLLPVLSPFARIFFEQEFFVSGKVADPFIQQTKAQIAQRLFTLGRMPKFSQMFSATEDLFDAYEHMQRKSVVLINTDARTPRVGGLGPEGSTIFGRYILAQCLEAARMRPPHQRHLALLIVDEAKAYMDEQSALILSDARQFGMGMLLASQQPHQLPEGVRREINTNTSIRMMGNIEYSVASQYARDMFCDPEFIIRCKKYDGAYAEWATYVSGMDRAVKVTVPYFAIERLPQRQYVNHPAEHFCEPSAEAAEAEHENSLAANEEEDPQPRSLENEGRVSEEVKRTIDAGGAIEQKTSTTNDDDHIRPMHE